MRTILDLAAHPDAVLSAPRLREPGGPTRRRFLQGLLVAGGVGASGIPSWMADAVGASITPLGSTEGVLVVVTLLGGNDSLNTLSPISGTDRSAYEALRPTLALPAAALLPVGDGTEGLHPSLGRLAVRFQQGSVALVRGVGRTSDGSHFVSQDSLMAGTATTSRATGWLGRYGDDLPDWQTGFRSVAVGSVPLHLRGSRVEVTGLPAGGALWGSDPVEANAYDAVRAMAAAPTGLGAVADSVAGAVRDSVDRAGTVSSLFGTGLPTSPLGRDLAMAARAINADLGTRCVAVGRQGWDTHATQAADHTALLAELDDAIDVFFATLSESFRRRVTLLVVSEFGRRAAENSGLGTDHGSAGMAMVIGDNVKGGLYGASPSLTTLDSTGSFVPTVDLRSVYTSVLGPWLAGDASATLGATYEDLQLFLAGPGVTPAP